MSLLHLDSSILGENSVSRTITAAVVDRLRQADPSLQVVYRDLAADPLPHLTFSALIGQGQEGAEARVVLREFMNASTVVIGAPMYNFTVPSQLKAWIDQIVIANETFRYGAAGAEGLAGDKRVIAVVSRGAYYGEDTPMAAFEHTETYLRIIFGFIGITQPEFIHADGITIGADQRASALDAALMKVSSLSTT